jgi:hypothetical protein
VNADKLQVGEAEGYQVIVGLDVKPETLGILFPPDGYLTKEMLRANNLYAKDPDTGEKKGGFFGPKGRIKVVRLRQVPSYAFWTELDSVAWTGIDCTKLKEGFTFLSLNGHEICGKYIPTETRKKAKSLSSKIHKENAFQRKF